MKVIPDNVSKHTNVYDVFVERGLLEQCTDPEGARKMLGEEKIKFYVGFDPTADCLHVGHLIQVIIFMYMLKYGHTPVALVGGGTTMIGDPSGRNDMRRIMTLEEIDQNGKNFKTLFERFLPFDDEWKYEGNEGVMVPGHQNKEPEPGKAISINNADWLRNLDFMEFSREISVHFNVNEMLRADCYKNRMADGLTFLEFSYMLMQAYDFYVMARDFGLKAQFGGNDQWSNIIAGSHLAKKRDNLYTFGMTFGLLTKSDGTKMGKTSGGALWLDENRVSVFDFFQYWRNVDDADVNKCLRMLTFLPMEEVERLSSLEGSAINEAKEILAFEVTELVHGTEKAQEALEKSRKVFAAGGADVDSMPTVDMPQSVFEGEGIGVAALVKEVGLVASNSEAFRMIDQGGIKINGKAVTDRKAMVTVTDINVDKIVVQKGKKKFVAINVK